MTSSTLSRKPCYRTVSIDAHETTLPSAPRCDECSRVSAKPRLLNRDGSFKPSDSLSALSIYNRSLSISWSVFLGQYDDRSVSRQCCSRVLDRNRSQQPARPVDRKSNSQQAGTIHRRYQADDFA